MIYPIKNNNGKIYILLAQTEALDDSHNWKINLKESSEIIDVGRTLKYP